MTTKDLWISQDGFQMGVGLKVAASDWWGASVGGKHFYMQYFVCYCKWITNDYCSFGENYCYGQPSEYKVGHAIDLEMLENDLIDI